MTALILDGFDHYGTGNAGNGNMLDGVWSSMPTNGFTVGVPSWGTARTGTSCLVQFNSSSPNQARIVVPGNPQTLFVSMGFACDILPTNTTPYIIGFMDASAAQWYSLKLGPTGTITLWDEALQEPVATTSGPVITTQTWHFLEMELNYQAGTFTLRVDDTDATGTPVISATGLATTHTNGILCFGWNSYITPGGVGNWYIDDLFVRDNNGTVNNGFLGDRRIAYLPINADTATIGWTPTYYQKFGAGVLQLAYMPTNASTPTNPNAFISTPAATALDLGSSDFTLETFIRFEALPATGEYAAIFNRWDTSGNQLSYRLILGSQSYNNGQLQFDYSTNGQTSGTVTAVQYPWTPNLNQWYHLAFVRASNELLLFVDGVQLGLPIACTATFFGGGSEALTIGAEAGTAGQVNNTYVTGLLDETRITNGYARYTTNFTPPTAAFPRGSGDPEWSQVVLLAGYDSTISDESSYNRTLASNNNAQQFTVNDGASVGVFSTIGKQTPDDNTFISAPFTAATSIYTLTTNPSNGQTVTVGTKDGTTPAVYTFKTTLAAAYDVLIGANYTATLSNLINAINAGTGSGTTYGAGTVSNYSVSASALPAGQIEVTALLAGTGGNSIATSSTVGSWTGTTLAGGANIPGPSEFKFQRPPPNTTIISAIQPLVRAYKSDSGTANIVNTFIGPLGGTKAGSTKSISTTPSYYSDIVELDPDTSAAISPSTLINGKFEINRTA